MFINAGGLPSQPTGWVANAYTSVSFDVPAQWTGRIWGRRNCDFSGPNSWCNGASSTKSPPPHRRPRPAA
ncbi:hypothetical protein MKEN_00021200 [Mycena kentingensis (nom. inval.)]|nr:hypothetical protein MKEN_00021200 [Mycena kentingensis (nom. inval.)]